jgi:hypothetical protein
MLIQHGLVSEIKYNSRITGKEEKLPIVVGLMGEPSTDMELLEWTVNAMRASGRAIKVKTGKAAF